MLSSLTPHTEAYQLSSELSAIFLYFAAKSSARVCAGNLIDLRRLLARLALVVAATVAAAAAAAVAMTRATVAESSAELRLDIW